MKATAPKKWKRTESSEKKAHRFHLSKQTNIQRAQELPRFRRRWTAEEDAKIKSQLKSSVKPKNIVVAGRSTSAIIRRMFDLGIYPKGKRWTEAEKRSLQTQLLDGKLLDNVVIKGRTFSAKKYMADSLKLSYWTAKQFEAEKNKKPKKTRKDRVHCHWQSSEDEILKKQIESGVSPRDVVVPGRTAQGIRVRILALKLVHTCRWSESQLESLTSQIEAGKKLEEITVEGKSPHAVSSQAIRLGLIKPKRAVKKWTNTEKEQAIALAQSGFTSSAIYEQEVFPGRSQDSIAQLLRRFRRAGLLPEV